MDILQLATDLIQRNIPCVLCTIVRTSGSVPRHAGAKMLVGADGTLLAGTVGGGEMENRVIEQAKLSFFDEKTSLLSYQLSNPQEGDAGVCGGLVEIFIEPLLTTPTLIIFGAGHVGRALTHLAKWSGFRVVLADDRTELCNATACPGADEYIPGPMRDTLGKLSLTPQTYVAMVTRGYPLDVQMLPLLLQKPILYIGVIGSHRRWLTSAKVLREQGISEADLERIHAPIGLEIGAETPEEIAISIVAEITQARRITKVRDQ
jgi:xanthine dehydrogenase accessory factor